METCADERLDLPVVERLAIVNSDSKMTPFRFRSAGSYIESRACLVDLFYHTQAYYWRLENDIVIILKEWPICDI